MTDAREIVTALRFFGCAREPLVLSPVRAAFTIGAGACDLVVPPELSTSVAVLHATIERTGSGLRIRDRGAHGVYRSLRGPRVSELHVEAGDVFWIADVALLAMGPHTETLRSRIAWCIGLDRHIAIDEAIEAVAECRPIVLVGARGTDGQTLAREIHEAGPRRAGRFLIGDSAPPSLDDAGDATVVVDLDRSGLSAPYAARLLNRARGPRAIFLATSDRRARAALDSYRDGVRAIAMVPLARRGDEIVRLLAIHWRDELRTGRRVDELGPRSLRGLSEYAWPGNLDELRAQSPRLLAYLEHGGLRRAAAALGVKHQTLGQHFARIGFEVADQAERDELPSARRQ